MTSELATSHLTAVEQSALTHAESKIERGLATFVEVGEALAEVRDSRLYRDEYDTFEAYCKQRWGLTRGRVYQLIDASVTTQQMSTIVDTPQPANEGQARELSGLEPEQAADVMRRAHETTDGNVTAAAIREARRPKQQVPDGLTRVTETSKSDTYVDSTTGEIVEPEPASKPKAKPTKASRRPLPDAFFDAAYDLTKKVEQIERLVADDRFPQNAEKVAAKHRNDLTCAIEALSRVVDRLPY